MIEQAPSPAFYDRFVLIIAGLRQIAALHLGRDRAQWPMMILVTNALGRRLARLDALVVRFRAGRLSPARPPGAGTHAAKRERVRTRNGDPDAPAMPRGRGWLARRMAGVWVQRLGSVATYAETVRILVDDAEMRALLAVSPQAGRLLRPLWRMVSCDPLPEPLRRVPSAPAGAPECGETPPHAPPSHAPPSHAPPSHAPPSQVIAGPSACGQPPPASRPPRPPAHRAVPRAPRRKPWGPRAGIAFSLA